MTAAAKRKEKMKRIRWLLARQGEDESLTRQTEKTTFPVHLEMNGLPELREPEGAAASITVHWHTIHAILVAWMVPGGLAQLRAAIDGDETSEQARERGARLSAEGLRRREPGMLRSVAAYKHMRIYAPEVFDGAMRLLLASAEAWATLEVDDDEERAAKIIDEALKVEAQAARERLNLRTTGRKPAVRRKQVRLALFSLFSAGAERPYTREQVADHLREEFGVIVTPRTLTDFATLTVYGDWDSFVRASVEEFEYLELLEDEELSSLIDETGSESN